MRKELEVKVSKLEEELKQKEEQIETVRASASQVSDFFCESFIWSSRIQAHIELSREKPRFLHVVMRKAFFQEIVLRKNV